MGGCAGGMMVAMATALLAARDDQRVHTATMVVTLLDCDTDGQILLFATPASMAAAKKASQLRGVLDGWQMAQIFAWLRPNDLVWNYWVNNYLLGRRPPAFDILAWNADTTRLAARFHHQLLDIVAGNQLTHPGALQVLGTPIDLSRITCDTYVAAGLTDHITPWQTCYRTTQLVSGNTQFVLCSKRPHPDGGGRARPSAARLLRQSGHAGQGAGLEGRRAAARGVVVGALVRLAGRALRREGPGRRRSRQRPVPAGRGRPRHVRIPVTERGFSARGAYSGAGWRLPARREISLCRGGIQARTGPIPLSRMDIILAVTFINVGLVAKLGIRPVRDGQQNQRGVLQVEIAAQVPRLDRGRDDLVNALLVAPPFLDENGAGLAPLPVAPGLPHRQPGPARYHCVPARRPCDP